MPIHTFRLGALPDSTERTFRALANSDLGAKCCSVHDNVLIAGAVIPRHKHAVEEILVCLGGSAECSFGDGTPEMYGEGSVVIIPANTAHTIRNTGPGTLWQISFFAGNPPCTEWLESPGSVDNVAT